MGFVQNQKVEWGLIWKHVVDHPHMLHLNSFLENVTWVKSNVHEKMLVLFSITHPLSPYFVFQELKLTYGVWVFYCTLCYAAIFLLMMTILQFCIRKFRYDFILILLSYFLSIDLN